jgi:DNA-binding CsgD family transcriptional regulator
MALQFHAEPARRRQVARDDRSEVRIALCPSEPPPPAPERDVLAEAHTADAAASPADLGALWQDFMAGRLRLDAAVSGPERHYVFLRIQPTPGVHLRALETTVLVRVFCGEQQKFVAAELSIACSTASKWFTLGVAKLGLGRRSVPLPLIVAAQAWSLSEGREGGEGPSVAARSTLVRREGKPMVLLSVPRPSIAPRFLTRAEEDVAALVAEGRSRWEIAVTRAKSAQTIACQLRGVYAKLAVGNRYALVRRGLDLGWFSAPQADRAARFARG